MGPNDTSGNPQDPAQQGGDDTTTQTPPVTGETPAQPEQGGDTTGGDSGTTGGDTTGGENPTGAPTNV